MKIAFTGASGTGKTTAAKKITEEFGLEFLDVGSRRVAKYLGFDSPYDTDRADLQVYLDMLYAFEDLSNINANSVRGDAYSENKEAARVAIEAYEGGVSCRQMFQRVLRETKIATEEKLGSFVTDRTTIDDLCYSSIHGEVTEEFVEQGIEHCSTYDLVFFLTLESFQNLGDDPLRRTEPEYHARYQTVLEEYWNQASPGKLVKISAPCSTKAELGARAKYILETVQGII